MDEENGREKPKRLEDFIVNKNGKPTVDWKGLVPPTTEHLRGLESLGILTQEKGYLLIGKHLILNPYVNGNPYYFSNRNDAERYRKAAFGQHLHQIKISRI